MSNKFVNVLAVLVLAGLMSVILANSMTKSLSHDEQMYCTGGVLLSQGKMIYRDFSYVGQMPYHALFYAILYKALGTTQYLLTGRMFSATCDIAVVICIIGLYRRVFESHENMGTILGLLSAILYVFNPVVDYANGLAWNHDAVILCVVLSLCLYLSLESGKGRRYWRIAVMGGLLTLATCMRITTALVQAIFFLALLLGGEVNSKERYKRALFFLLGTGLMLIWPVWTIAAGPREFFLNIVWLPMLNGQWQRQINMEHNKLVRIVDFLTTPNYILLIVMCLHFYILAFWRRHSFRNREFSNTLFTGFVALTFFVIAFVPPTMLRQYAAMPVVFLILGFSYPLFYLLRVSGDKQGLVTKFNIHCIVLAACAAVSIATNPVVLWRVPQLFNQHSWVAMRVHSIAEDIAKKNKGSEPVLTLGPLFALEGGSEIYTEFSAGSFAYRVGDFMSESSRESAHIVSPETVWELAESRPPKAVILGLEPSFLEAPLYHMAVREDWVRVTYVGGVVAYLRR